MEQGYLVIGWDCFRYIMQDDRFNHMPLILETINPDIWHQEIATLRDFAAQK